MKRAWLLVLAASANAQTDNPVASRYGAAAYPWTDEIRWHVLVNINDFSGSTMTGRFVAARNAVVAAGGGVIFFPAGTYNFEDTIRLTNGVVLRGATPTNGILDATAAGFAPPSKLVFPQYIPSFTGSGTPNSTAFKKIYTAAGDTDCNIGLVHLDVNRAGINLQGAMNAGRNRNILVFGVRNNNVAEASPDVPASFQPAWSRYSYRFAANIRIQAYANALVANNRINDAITDNFNQPGYVVTNTASDTLVTFTDGTRVPFHYGNHYGIVVNRNASGGYAVDPLEAPSLFRPGLVIRDNYVYHTMRVAIHAAGQGLIIRNNIIRDQAGKQWWTNPIGTQQGTGAQTLENRGIDWAGWDVRVEGNDYQVYRHLMSGGPYLSVDGEGILIQECCGGTQVNGVTITRNTGNAYIGFYKMPTMTGVTITSNTVTDTGLGLYVNADPNGGSGVLGNALIAGNTVTGPITVRATGGGSNVTVTGNTGAGAISASCFVTVTNNPGFTVNACSANALANLPPAVSITNPLTGAQLDAGTNLIVTATAHDLDGAVASVALYTNGVFVATSFAAPFTFTLTNLPTADISLVAAANDTGLASQLSAPVFIAVGQSSLAAWRQEHFGTNPDLAADLADPDGDGLPNLLEYALNMNPNIPSLWPGGVAENDHLTLTYPRRKPPTDITYLVEVTDRVTGGWTTNGVTEQVTPIDATFDSVKAIDPATISSNTQRYIHLKVTRP